MEFDAGDDESGEYKVEVIRDSIVYARESESGLLSGFYYLVSWKGYPEEENTREPASAVQHPKKLISSFHKDHPDMLTATSPAINTAPSMARPTVTPTEPHKRKREQPANSINKRAKKNWAAVDFYRVFGRIRVIYTFNILSQNACDWTWLHMTARNYTWLSSNLHQNFLQDLDSLDLLSLIHKASVFFLELALGQEVFH